MPGISLHHCSLPNVSSLDFTTQPLHYLVLTLHGVGKGAKMLCGPLYRRTGGGERGGAQETTGIGIMRSEVLIMVSLGRYGRREDRGWTQELMAKRPVGLAGGNQGRGGKATCGVASSRAGMRWKYPLGGAHWSERAEREIGF